jgi:hypothetical protein
MRKCAIASVLVVAFATAALAAGAKYYVEMDTVGNCSVVDSKPSASSGMKIMGDNRRLCLQGGCRQSPKGPPKG